MPSYATTSYILCYATGYAIFYAMNDGKDGSDMICHK